MREIESVLYQSHISQKNLHRLSELSASDVAEVATAAILMAEIGKLYPFKRRRFKKMCRANRDLMRRLGEVGFILWVNYHDERDDGAPDSLPSMDGDEPWSAMECEPLDDEADAAWEPSMDGDIPF